jgi:hypothetical protein
MSIQRALAVCVAMIAASVSASFASPCSQDIDRTQAMIDAKLEAQAAAGRSARESTAATLHRQPTPGSIAAAEVQFCNPDPGTTVPDRPAIISPGTGRSAAIIDAVS